MGPFDGAEHAPYQQWHRDGAYGDGSNGQLPRRFRAEYIQAMVYLSDVCVKVMNFVFKPRNCVSKTRICVLKMMNFK